MKRITCQDTIADRSLDLGGKTPESIVVKYLDGTDNTIKYISKKGPFTVEIVN